MTVWTVRIPLGSGLAFAVALLAACTSDPPAIAPETLSAELAKSKYVYIESTRKDGQFGKPAEISFFVQDGAVFVTSKRSTWRVRRIEAGRPRARIAVGRIDGPAFIAMGQIVSDASAQQTLAEVFARKYPEDWAKYKDQVQAALKKGSRVIIKYVPVG